MNCNLDVHGGRIALIGAQDALGLRGRWGAFAPSSGIERPLPLTRREVALAALAACVARARDALAAAAAHGRDVPRDIGDPLVQAWQVAWGGHALLHQPLDYFQANTFWPLRQQPRVLRRARRATRRRARSAAASHAAVAPLRPAVPVRLRALLLRRVPAGAGARRGPRGRRRRRRGVRVRAVAARAGRAPARALERRHPARRCSCCARIPARRAPASCSPAGSWRRGS